MTHLVKDSKVSAIAQHLQDKALYHDWRLIDTITTLSNAELDGFIYVYIRHTKDEGIVWRIKFKGVEVCSMLINEIAEAIYSWFHDIN
jgi:hypothetical protein